MLKGEARIDGMDIRKPSKAFFNLIGVSFEQPNFYEKLTGLENSHRISHHRGKRKRYFESPFHISHDKAGIHSRPQYLIVLIVVAIIVAPIKIKIMKRLMTKKNQRNPLRKL